MNKKRSAEEQHKKLLDTCKTIIRDNQKEYDRMERNLKVYEGNLWNTEDSEFIRRDMANGRSEVQVNLPFANIEQTAPLVTANRPKTKVVPKYPFLEPMGVAINDVIKYVWDAADIPMALHRAVKAKKIYGTTYFKVQFDPEKKFGGDIDICVVDSRKFAIAPGYDEIWRAPFVFEWDDKPESWVKSNFPDVELKPDKEGKKSSIKFGDVENSEGTKFIRVYEMWSRDSSVYESDDDDHKKGDEKYPYGKTCWFTEKQMLKEVANEADHGLPPYVEYHNYIRPNNFLGIGDVDVILGLHKEINRILKYLVEFTRKHHDPNYLVDISRLEGATYEKIINELTEGGHYFPWNSMGDNSAVPPIQQIEDGQLPGEMVQLLRFLLEQLDLVSGVTDVRRGIIGKSERQSASEVAMLKESTDTRVQQEVDNLKWSLKRLTYLIVRLAMQYYETPRQMSFEEDGARVYSEYGNSYAQAREIMTPKPLSKRAEEGVRMGHLTEENQEEVDRWKQEQSDYEKFLEFAKGDGEEPGDFDPFLFDFEMEVQADTVLPTDKQSRANLAIRLRQFQAMDIITLYEFLGLPNGREVLERIKEEMGQGQGNDAQLAAQNPALYQQYKQEMARRGA